MASLIVNAKEAPLRMHSAHQRASCSTAVPALTPDGQTSKVAKAELRMYIQGDASAACEPANGRCSSHTPAARYFMTVLSVALACASHCGRGAAGQRRHAATAALRHSSLCTRFACSASAKHDASVMCGQTLQDMPHALVCKSAVHLTVPVLLSRGLQRWQSKSGRATKVVKQQTHIPHRQKMSSAGPSHNEGRTRTSMGRQRGHAPARSPCHGAAPALAAPPAPARPARGTPGRAGTRAARTWCRSGPCAGRGTPHSAPRGPTGRLCHRDT
jgi:hypothetical protein